MQTILNRHLLPLIMCVMLIVECGICFVGGQHLLLYENNTANVEESWELDQGWKIGSFDNESVLEGKGHSWVRYRAGILSSHYTFRSRINFQEGGIHINFNLGEQGRYFVGLREDLVYLKKESPWGEFFDLQEKEFFIERNQWYVIAISFHEKRIAVFLNDELLLEAEDEDPLRAGTVAYETLEESLVLVGETEVSVLFAEGSSEDNLPDLVVHSLEFARTGNNNLVVQVQIENTGNAPARNVPVDIGYETRVLESLIIDEIAPQQLGKIEYVLEGDPWRKEDLVVNIDPEKTIKENNIYNNWKSKSPTLDPEDLKYIKPPNIIVNTTYDSIFDFQNNNKQPCSLREAIKLANDYPGPDTIGFNIPKTDPGYDSKNQVWIFNLKGQLPDISGDYTIIDGSWSNVKGNSKGILQLLCQKPSIELNGEAGGINTGLAIKSNNSSVKGIAIYNFSKAGIIIEGSLNKITCNFIGTNLSENDTLGNETGIVILGSSANPNANNVIGEPGAGNLISGNKLHGLLIRGKAASGNTIQANFIGVKSNGFDTLCNNNGITIENGAMHNSIGGNIISGNHDFGVYILESDSNLIYNNYIGVGENGSMTVGNDSAGILLVESSYNKIGGERKGNVISGNGTGIYITANTRSPLWYLQNIPVPYSSFNSIEANFLGTTAQGTEPSPNKRSAVHLDNFSHHNHIGDQSGNVIAGNTEGTGIIITHGSHHNNVYKNLIGIGYSNIKLPNNLGIKLEDEANNNIIGGSKSNANIIACNLKDGVRADGPGVLDNGITFNSVYKNGGNGISLRNGAHGNIPWLRVWEIIDLGGNNYYVIGQVDDQLKSSKVLIYSDDENQGEYCLTDFVIPGKIRLGWFGVKITRTAANLTFLVSDSIGLNTTEFKIRNHPKQLGTWKWDMDYWETDKDNHFPLNPNYHGGWGNWPPIAELDKEFDNGFTKGDIAKIVHNVSMTDGTWCNYFTNYGPQMVTFTGDLYWETYFTTDDDYNLGLLTPPGTGTHMYTQRLFDPSASGQKSKKVYGIPMDMDDGKYSDNERYNFLWNYLLTTGYLPILTLEIDQGYSFEEYDKHPYWKKLLDAVDKGTGTVREMLDGSKTIAMGLWCMDCQHHARSELHPVFAMAIQDKAPLTQANDEATWHFFVRHWGTQNYCGEDFEVPHAYNWKFRLPVPEDKKIKSIKGLNGYSHEEEEDTTYWKVYKSGKDGIAEIHLQNQDDWLVGTVVIAWE